MEISSAWTAENARLLLDSWDHPIPYDNSKTREARQYKVIPSNLFVRMFVAMTLHLKPGEPGREVLWLIDTRSPSTFISREVCFIRINKRDSDTLDSSISSYSRTSIS
jgi:hypothetical protein